MSPNGDTFPREITSISLPIAAFVSDDLTNVFMKVREGVARKGSGEEEVEEEGDSGGEKERGTRQLVVNVDV